MSLRDDFQALTSNLFTAFDAVRVDVSLNKVSGISYVDGVRSESVTSTTVPGFGYFTANGLNGTRMYNLIINRQTAGDLNVYDTLSVGGEEYRLDEVGMEDNGFTIRVMITTSTGQ